MLLLMMRHWSLLENFPWKNSILSAFVGVVIATASALIFSDSWVSTKVEASPRVAGLEYRVGSTEKEFDLLKQDIREMKKDVREILLSLERLKTKLEKEQ